jgi:hypothetical protein
MLQLQTDPNFENVKDDPVRPELTMEFRISKGREVYTLYNKDFLTAVICVAYTNKVPTTVKQLDSYSVPHEEASIAIFYTVWSYYAGSGRKIIFGVVDHMLRNRPTINRFVTLSPKTTMAYRFHTGNGAKQIAQNKESDNYEYFVQRTVGSKEGAEESQEEST